MNTYHGDFRFRVSGCGSDDDFEAHLDDVLDFLSEDDRIEDPDYTATLARRCVMFSLTTTASDQAEAFLTMHTALRSAIHTAEGSTPGWESHFSELNSSVRSAEATPA